MEPGARGERGIECLDRTVVRDRVRDGIGGGLEQEEEPVGLVDLSAAVDREEIARDPVVRGPEPRHRGVAQALGERGAVHDVGEEQRAFDAHEQILCAKAPFDGGYSLALGAAGGCENQPSHSLTSASRALSTVYTRVRPRRS